MVLGFIIISIVFNMLDASTSAMDVLREYCRKDIRRTGVKLGTLFLPDNIPIEDHLADLCVNTHVNSYNDVPRYVEYIRQLEVSNLRDGSDIVARLDRKLIDLAFHPTRKLILNDASDIVSRQRGLVIVTHQIYELQKATNDFLLTKSRLKHIPRIALVSPQFPVDSNLMSTGISLFKYSMTGRFNSVPVADRYYLVGGVAETCLSNTIVSIVKENIRRKRTKPVEIEIVGDLVYVGTPGFVNLSEFMKKRTKGQDYDIFNFLELDELDMELVSIKHYNKGKIQNRVKYYFKESSGLSVNITFVL